MTTDDSQDDLGKAVEEIADQMDDHVDDSKTRTVGVAGHSVTLLEVYALLLGVASGVATGYLWLTGREELAAALVAFGLGYAIVGRPLGKSLSHEAEEYRDVKQVAVRVIRYEPVWYTLGYALAGVLAGLAMVLT